MNYIELSNNFWTSQNIHSFNTTEIALYFYLINVFNICRWESRIKRNNRKIEADLNISFNTLKNARNKLMQAGLIYFKSQNGNANVSYSLSNFDEVSSEVGSEVSSEVCTRLMSTKTKVKTKLNNKENNNKKKNFIRPTVEEVKAYIEERNSTIDAERFHSYYEANGWVQGKSPIKDWKACVRTWERNESKKSKPQTIVQQPKSKIGQMMDVAESLLNPQNY